MCRVTPDSVLYKWIHKNKFQSNDGNADYTSDSDNNYLGPVGQVTMNPALDMFWLKKIGKIKK